MSAADELTPPTYWLIPFDGTLDDAAHDRVPVWELRQKAPIQYVRANRTVGHLDVPEWNPETAPLEWVVAGIGEEGGPEVPSRVMGEVHRDFDGVRQPAGARGRWVPGGWIIMPTGLSRWRGFLYSLAYGYCSGFPIFDVLVWSTRNALGIHPGTKLVSR